MVGAFAFVAALALAPQAQAQDCYIGEVRMFAGNFAPRGYALAQGQLLSIAQNTALFSILGTMYGGNGQTTFGLPDLRGRYPIGTGQGPGLSPYVEGQMGGTESVTLLSTQMPAHTHTVTLRASSSPATHIRPQGRVLAKVDPNATVNVYTPGPTDVDLAPDAAAASVAGGSQPFSIMPPHMGINFIVCMEGIYPSRN
jgi:microcystin-dependent protein